MTKAQEIQAYHAFIQSLPEASYIRPWFVEISVEVENLLRSDIIPDISPRRAEIEVRDLREQSLLESRRTVEAAQTEALKIKADAERYAASLKQHARQTLLNLANSI